MLQATTRISEVSLRMLTKAHNRPVGADTVQQGFLGALLNNKCFRVALSSLLKKVTRASQSVVADRMLYLSVEGVLGLAVEDKDHGGTSTTEDVGTGTLEEGGDAFLGADLGEAVGGSLVDAVLDFLLGLHLQSTAHGIEGVGDETGHDDGELSAGPLGGNADDGDFLGVGVQADEGVVKTELHTTVRDDTGDRDAEAVVQGEHALGSGGSLLEAVAKALEGLLAGADIGGETGTGVVQRVDDAQGAGTGETARGEVDAEELPELLLGGVLGEAALDGVLEGKVEGLRGEVAKAVGEVTTPESGDALLGGDTREAVHDASVPGHLARDDRGVGILSLDNQLHTLDGSGDGLGDGSGDTTSGKVNENIAVFSHDCVKRAVEGGVRRE